MLATSGVVRRIRGWASDARAGDGDVGRDRLTLASGPGAFGERGEVGVRALFV